MLERQKLQVKNLMSVEKFFPLKMADSKSEKYCPRQSHSKFSLNSHWIPERKFSEEQVLDGNPTLCRGVFTFSMKDSTQEKMTRVKGHTLEAHNKEKMLRAGELQHQVSVLVL